MTPKSLYRLILLAVLPALLIGLLFNRALGPDRASAQAPFVLAATGDGAAGTTQAGIVSDMLVSWNPNLFLYLGDVYENGTPTEFQTRYGTDTTLFGRLKPVTKPVVGNHEYGTSGASGYFQYWNNIPSYHSYDANGWHFIALNSNISAGSGSAQYNWLAQDLAANTAACTIAYYHHPIYNIGQHSSATGMRDAWTLMAQSGVDIVFNGHDHNYQRWKPLDQNGNLVTNGGVTQFVAGGGGKGLYAFTTSDSRVAVGFDSAPNAYGALRLELSPTNATFQYINSQGTVVDSGTIPCSGVSAATPTSTSAATATRTPTTAVTATPAATGQPGTFTFTPEADSYVSASSSGSNYGRSTQLRVDGSPDVRSYVRFRVQGLSGQVASAQVRIYANSSSSAGIDLHQVSDQTWGESSLTYNNAPALGSQVGSSGSTAAGSWVTVDVTGLVSGNGAVSLGMVTPGSTAISFSSREGSRPPELIIQTAGSASTPTATPQPISSPTPTRTPTLVASPTATQPAPPTATTAPSTGTFTPEADSYVSASSPGSNYGSSTQLRLDGSPIVRSYLRFTVQGISGSVSSARLRIYANSSSTSGLDAAQTSNTWSETGLTYSNAPAPGAAVGSSGAARSGAWVEMDVTGYVTGNGTFSFVVSTPGSTAISLSSREGARPPELVVASGP